MKRKFLLLTILLIVGAWGSNLYAQEDVTDTYLTNADLNSLDGWSNGDDGYTYTNYKTDGAVPVIEFYYQWTPDPNVEGTPIGSTRNFHLSQKVKLPAGSYRLSVNGFYREGNGLKGENKKAYIFAGDQQKYLVALTQGALNPYAGSNDLYKAATAFSEGNFANAFDFDVEINDGDEGVVIEDGVAKKEIELGFRGYIDTYISWCILGPVKLYKYSLQDYLVAYREKVAEAEAYYKDVEPAPMNADVLAALKNAVVEESTLVLVKDVTAAITNLDEKIADVKASIASYQEALGVINAAGTLTASGKSAYANSAVVKAIQDAYDARTLTKLTDEEKAAAKEALAVAVKQQTEVGADYTPAAPTTWVGQNGTYGSRVERYTPKDGLPPMYTGDVMTQTIEGVPAGAYTVVIQATASYTSGRGFEGKTGKGLTVVFGNEQTTDIEVFDRTGVAESDFLSYSVTAKVGEDGILKYGLKNIAEGANWFVIGLVSITKAEYIPVETLTADDIEVEVLKTANIVTALTPENATFQDITYTSADETIATVDKAGVVTGVAVGETIITLKADEVTKVINVTVKAPAVLPSSITLNKDEFALDLGKNKTGALTANVLPGEANQEVTFTSSDTNVATVNEKGEITATGLGTAIITVASVAKPEVTATANVVVTAVEAPVNFAETIESGKDYWILNAATGKYLGGGNSWGTHASIIEHGIPFKVTENDGFYTLDSYTFNGPDRHFLNPEGFVDQAAFEFKIEPLGNGLFTIGFTETVSNPETEPTVTENYLTANGANTVANFVAGEPNALGQWYFISRDNLLERLEQASEDNPVDATFLIKDFNFSKNNGMYSAWEKEPVKTGNEDTFINSQNPVGNNDASRHFNYNVESYHKTFSFTQTLAVPNGKYKLTAQGFYRNDGSDTENIAYFFANDEKQTLPKKTTSENSMYDAAVSFTVGKFTIQPIEVEVTDHVLKIGVSNPVNTSLWCIWDNFELEAIGQSADQDIVVPISSVGYATLYYGNLNLKAPAGVTANTVTVDGDVVNLAPVADVIPAGTGVVLQGEVGSYNFAVSYDDAPAVADNMLLGTDEETTIDDAGFEYYMLSTMNQDPESVGFYYQVEGGKSIVNKAHKAYLKVAEENAAAFYRFDGATGIRQITATELSNGDVYTISGMRVNGKDLQKGMYIVNGKKVIVK